MKKLLSIVILLLIGGNMAAKAQTIPKAEKGTINLSNYDFQKNEPIALNGQWLVYWDTLLTPQQIINNPTLKPQPVDVPVLWNNIKRQTNHATGIGFATYRLKIKKKPTDKILAFRIGRIETAYKMWVNGQLIISVGQTATNKQNSKPAWIRKEVTFENSGSELDIIIQVSNFHHRKGGIGSDILIGNADKIQQSKTKQISIQLFLIGVLLIMSLYHFGLYILDKEDPSTLYFGIATFTTVVFMMASSELILSRILPEFNWNLLVRINHWSNHLRVLFFALFLGTLFKKQIHPLFLKVLVGWVAITSVIILVTPPRIFSFNLIIFILVTLVSLSYLIVALIKASLQKADGAIHSLIGTSVLLLSAINDALHDLGIIHTFFMVPLGLFVFVFFQAFMLSLRSARSKHSIKNLSADLLSLDKIKNQFLSINSYNLSDYLKVLALEINSQKSFFLLQQEDQWYLKSQVLTFENSSADLNIPLHELKESEFAKNIIQEVISTKETISCDKACMTENYKNHQYIINHQINSILSIPVIDRGKVKAILYFEHSQQGAFSLRAQKVLDLLSSQIVTMIDNIIIHNQLVEFNQKLEEKVEQRTQEVVQQKEEIEAQRDELEQKSDVLKHTMNVIEQKNKEITDSINYAQRIQSAIFPTHEMMQQLLPQSFVFLSPKNVLSGDFYWLEHVFTNTAPGQPKTEKIILAAVDCTGHGVPGALMSIIGNNLLNYAVFELKKHQPHEILHVLEDGVVGKLKQKDIGATAQDGMDAAIICYDPQKKQLSFSGAHNPIYHISQGKGQMLKPNKYSIGGATRHNIIKQFTSQTISIQPNDSVYLFSDGFVDQFGGPKQRKYMRARFFRLLNSIAELDMQTQKEKITTELLQWKGDLMQIDDILVIGIKF